MKAQYDANAKTREIVPGTFKVDEKVFVVKRSGSALKKLVGLDPGGDKSNDPDANVDLMYKGISLVLIDPEKDPEISEEDDKGIWRPKPEWLEDEVDFDVAEDFMISILPTRGRDEVVPSARSSAPAESSTDSSTP